MEQIKKSYYAIIPANVRYDKNITPNAKLLYGEITALCNEKGYCWAENKYFAELYSVSKTSISKWIKSLIDGGYINSQIVYKEGSKEIAARYLTIVNNPIKENLNTPLTNVNEPIEEKLKDNNTINNTKNNTSNNIREENKALTVKADKKQLYGTFNNVRLTPTEYEKLSIEFPNYLEAIEYLSEYLESTGKKYKSHNLALRRWVFDAIKEKHLKQIELEQREKRAAEIAKKQTLTKLKDFYGSIHFESERDYSNGENVVPFDDIDKIKF